MKKYMFILLAAFAFVACCDDENGLERDNDGNIGLNDTSIYMLTDAQFLKVDTAYALDNEDFYLMKHYPYYYNEGDRKTYAARYDSIDQTMPHKPLAYDNLRIMFHTDAQLPEQMLKVEGSVDYIRFTSSVSQEIAIPTDLYSDWEGFMAEKIFSKRFCFANRGGAAHFFTAQLNDKVIITANRELFGLESGSDLSEHFEVEAPALCLPKGPLTDFSLIYNYGDDITTNIHEYMTEGSWLQSFYAFWLKDMPAEQYESIQFTISIPVKCEYWWDFYTNSQKELKTTTRILSATCDVTLGKMSEFEGLYRARQTASSEIWWQ